MLDWTDRRPDAELDLHGQTVVEAVANAERFLRAQAKARPGGVLRVVTGRGRGGGGCATRGRWCGTLRWKTPKGASSCGYGEAAARFRPHSSSTRPSTRLTEAVCSPRSVRQVSRSIRPRRTHCIIHWLPCAF